MLKDRAVMTENQGKKKKKHTIQMVHNNSDIRNNSQEFLNTYH